MQNQQSEAGLVLSELCQIQDTSRQQVTVQEAEECSWVSRQQGKDERWAKNVPDIKQNYYNISANTFAHEMGPRLKGCWWWTREKLNIFSFCVIFGSE